MNVIVMKILLHNFQKKVLKINVKNVLNLKLLIIIILYVKNVRIIIVNVMV